MSTAPPTSFDILDRSSRHSLAARLDLQPDLQQSTGGYAHVGATVMSMSSTSATRRLLSKKTNSFIHLIRLGALGEWPHHRSKSNRQNSSSKVVYQADQLICRSQTESATRCHFLRALVVTAQLRVIRVCVCWLAASERR